MGIIVNLDVMMAKRKKSLTELAAEVDLTLANLSILKNNKAKAVRFTTWRQSAEPWTASREISWNMWMIWTAESELICDRQEDDRMGRGKEKAVWVLGIFGSYKRKERSERQLWK